MAKNVGLGNKIEEGEMSPNNDTVPFDGDVVYLNVSVTPMDMKMNIDSHAWHTEGIKAPHISIDAHEIHKGNNYEEKKIPHLHGIKFCMLFPIINPIGPSIYIYLNSSERPEPATPSN